MYVNRSVFYPVVYCTKRQGAVERHVPNITSDLPFVMPLQTLLVMPLAATMSL